jgi:hypothetical protein
LESDKEEMATQCSQIIDYSVAKFGAAAKASCSSRYLAACLVYLAYAIGMVLVNTGYVSESNKDSLYFQFGVVHMINAWMFVYSWVGKSWTDKVLFPEYLNVIGAGLYMWSRQVCAR